MVEIKVTSDFSEIVSYNFENFLVCAKKNWLSNYPNMTAVSHWHSDIEFIIVLQGKILYSVNGKDQLLEKGQCIFVNSGQLHSSHAVNGCDCKFLCLLFHPSLFTTVEQIKDSYVKSISQNQNIPYYLLSHSVKWQSEVIIKLQEIFELCQTYDSGFELIVLSHLYSLWHTLYQNLLSTSPNEGFIVNKRLESLHSMIGYIQNCYSTKLTLEKIALAGCVCRSSCCDIFQSILGITPIQYVTNYRIEKSIEYLNNSTLSITEIAMRCGFNSSSYYTELFHRELGCTPSEYKKRILNST
ncbi:AraC family transcriptional regulator [Anaerosporobacter sp.]